MNKAIYTGPSPEGGLSPETCPFGCGTVFELSPPASGVTWNETTLYSFRGGSDAEAPKALTRVGEVLYGIATGGGESGLGAVFRLAPGANGSPWKETVVYSFPGGDYGGPPVLFAVDRNCSPQLSRRKQLFLTMMERFTERLAAVFPKLLTVQFSSSRRRVGKKRFCTSSLTDSMARTPKRGLTMGGNGVLYGTTTGFGEQGLNHLQVDSTDKQRLAHRGVFGLTPPSSSSGEWTETTLHAFTGGSDGGTPLDGLLLKNGILFGTTYEGGDVPNCNCGTVFAIKP